MLAFTAASEANIKCPTSQQCDCLPKIKEDQSEVTCHREDNPRSHILLVHVEVNNLIVFQCNPSMLWIDFDLLDGLSVGPVESVMFSFCPVPNKPFLKFFQSFSISETTKFTYHNTNISNTLDRSQFTGLVNLTSLSLNSCGITGLPADIFLDLTQLTTLDLRDNNIELPLHIFDHLSKLQVLELGNNNISHLEKGIFQNLTSLRVLNLWSNNLENLSREIFSGLSKVEYLELSFNKLTSLPVDVFAEMPKMKEISLHGNMFTSLPEGLFSFIPLVKRVKLHNNRQPHQVLPSGLLANLTNLEEVYLNMCGLTSLPEDIFWGSTEIKNLSLQGNAFVTLPEKLFKDSTKIVFLDLSYNQLEEIPDNLFLDLYKLRVLNLGYNQLTNITRNLYRDTKELANLNMEHNKLQFIARSTFNHLKKLTHLQLSNNQLTMRNEPFHNSLLNECTNLEELYLAYNNITTIFDDWCNTMINLHILDLSHNALSSLTVTDLHFLSTSITVDLTYNNISVIYLRDQNPPIVYRSGNSNSPPIQRSFKLDGNPIVCDCLTYDLLLYLEHKMDPEVYELYQLEPGNLTCTGPSYFKGIPVNKLHSEKLECLLPQPEICPKPCTCTMRPSDSAFRINCSGKQLIEVPQLPELNRLDQLAKKWFHLTLNHTELLFSKNKIRQLPTIRNLGYSQVTKLYFSYNNISALSTENLPPVIKEMELHNNNLTHLNESVLDIFANVETGLQHVTLHKNPWQCDCKARGLLNFLQEHFTQVPYLSNITCNDGSGRALRNLTITELCPASSAGIVAASVLVALLGIMIGVLAALYYYYHREVKVWLFAHGWCLWFVTEEELDKDKLYDAFISYSHRDEAFVVNELVPQLESGSTPFKLCLHYRDWIAGEWIPNQIARSVEDSKRTLVVLSPSFLESVWGRMEFRTAHSQALSEGRARVIVLLYGDVGPLDQLDPELRAYLSMNTYVKWGDPWFWDKLRYALPHPQDQTKKRGIELKPSKTSDGKLELTNHSTPPAATTPPTETIKNPLDITKMPISMATNGHATLLAEANGHVNKCFVKSV